MSFYSMGSTMNSMPLDPEKIRLAETELAMLQSLHQSMIDGCKKKCFVNYYTETELSKGEGCCVDRCASKFFKVNMVIGEHLRNQQVDPHYFTSPSMVKNSLGQHSTLK